MEWFATQWVFMQPARMRASWKMGHHAACSDEGVMENGASKYSILGRVHRRYWREIIQFNASEFGDEFSEEFGEEFGEEFNGEFGGPGHHLSTQRYNTLSNRHYS
jgi:hypothetical protein